MLDYRIESFLSLCETRSYTQTAQYLHLTQPAVTQHIKALEQFYQCQLFRYEGRQMLLTEAGTYLQTRMQVMRAQEAEIQNHLQCMKRCIPLAVGITPSVAQSKLLEPLCRQMQPEARCFLRLHMNSCQANLRRLKEGSLDVAVVEGDVLDSQLEATVLCQERLIAVSGTALAEKLYGTSWQQILQQKLLLAAPGSGIRAILQTELRRRGITIQDFAAVCEVNSFDVLKELLYLDVGIAFLFESTFAQEKQAGRLRRVYFETTAAYGNISFVTMRNRLASEKLQVLQEALQEALDTPESAN